MLLQSEHRTLDPEEADFFYIPVSVRSTTLGCAGCAGCRGCCEREGDPLGCEKAAAAWLGLAPSTYHSACPLPSTSRTADLHQLPHLPDPV